jgi:two-component system chemotaxis response regulator CheY
MIICNIVFYDILYCFGSGVGSIEAASAVFRSIRLGRKFMPKALIVDDAAFMRVKLKNVLEPAGYEILEAENGVVAVEKYSEHRPDVVTMDITMPEMDGIQAVRKILSADPRAKVVIVSELGQESVVKDAILAGAKDFIVKPFQPDRVLDAIKKVLE